MITVNSIKKNIYNHIKSICKIKLYFGREYRSIKNSELFDKEWYLCNNPDVKNERIDAVEHYIKFGWQEGRNPSNKFDGQLYLKTYTDVKDCNINPLFHYEIYGKYENRKIFSTSSNSISNIGPSLLSLINEYKKINPNSKILLLITHTLDLTGAPRALLNMAIELKKIGYYPIFLSLKNGPMLSELESNNIPVILENLSSFQYCPLDSISYRFINIFDCIIFNTLVTLQLVNSLKNTKPYKLCWVHEGSMEFEKNSVIDLKNIFQFIDEVYSVGEYCKKFTDKYVDSSKSKLLLYGIEDKYSSSIEYNKDKIIFALIGSICERKAQKILVNSIKHLSEHIISKSEFWFIGPNNDDDILNEIQKLSKQYSNVKYLGQLNNNEVINLLSFIDVIINPSLDDPMPITATEGMMLNKVVIVSDNTGTASYIKNGNNGYVIKTGDVEDLTDVIIKIHNKKNELSKIGEEARKIYENHFSMHVFSNTIKDIFTRLFYNENQKANNDLENYQIDFQKEIQVYNCNNIKNIKIFDIQEDNDFLRISVSSDIIDNIKVYYQNKYYHALNQYKFDYEHYFNCYLNKSNERLYIFELPISKNGKISIKFYQEDNDNLNLEIANFINMYKLSKKNYFIIINKNHLSLVNKNEFLEYSKASVINKKEESQLLKELMKEQDKKYILYFETLDNANDNAYMLFLEDLKYNNNAYFVTSKFNYEREKNIKIKDHMIILNSKQHKDYAIKAKTMIVSWWCFPIYGYEKSLYLYPYFNYNFIAVLHGISYDKDSYYLNKNNFGNVDCIYCCSNYEKEFLEKCNGHSNIKVLGYPRMDKWYNSEIDENYVFLFPTWRKNIENEYIQHIIDICYKIIKCTNLSIIYASHPSISKDKFRNLKLMLQTISNRINVISSSDREEFNNYFSKSKYLITDYSSVAYDFIYKLNGVAIYYTPLAKYDNYYTIRDVFKEANCGLAVDTLDDLISILEGDYDYSYIKNRRDKFFNHIDNHNTKRVYEDILKTIE
ncbi:glycosyltransferase [Lachnoclostridium phytofermentans]|uniref:glycosyltransferase n=1 Tax=Lachnoclostridium phytofermentans TaxID=66219 RepID=UPI00049583C8|nr:glycosyltransferase [Lachnoclostridium phytofermentans]